MPKLFFTVLATLCALPAASNATTISVSGPFNSVQEGHSTQLTVFRNPAAGTALTVTLTSSDPATLTVPASITIPAQATVGYTTLTAGDNSLRDGSRSVIITGSADGASSGTTNVVVRDNEVAGYRFSVLKDLMTLPLQFGVAACDIEGNAIDYSGEVSITLLRTDGTAVAAPCSFTLTGSSGAWVTVPAPVVADGLRVHVEDANGVSSTSPPVYPMRRLGLTTADLVFDSHRNCFYASVPTSAGGDYAGKVVRIDPATMEVSGGTVMQDPGPLALTDDGNALYVGRNGNATVAKLNAATLAVQSTFPVGVDPTTGTLIADELTTVAGSPNEVIISRRQAAQPQNSGGVALYLDGKVLPAKLLIQNTGRMRVERSADPSIFFVYGPVGFRRVKRDATGLTELSYADRLFPSETTDIASAGNTVVSNTGVAVDGSTMTVLGQAVLPRFHYPGAACLDPDHNRLYMFESAYPPPTAYVQALGVYDPESYQLIRSFSTPMMSASGRLLRWGAHGLAFRDATSVALVNSRHVVPDLKPANVSVSVETTPSSPAIGAPIVYSVTVANHGPETARDVFVRGTASAGQGAPVINPARAATYLSGSSASARIGDLPAGNQVQFTVTTTAQSAGLVSCTVSADSASLDPDMTDNTETKIVNAGYAVGPDSSQALRFGADNMVYDSTRKLLWIATSDKDRPGIVNLGVGPTLVGMDPVTGAIVESFPLAHTVGFAAMGISKDGHYLYTGLAQMTEVQRIDLTTTPPVSVLIPLVGDTYQDTVTDLEVLDGDGTSFAAITAYYPTPAVYDGTVRRMFSNAYLSSYGNIEKTGTSGVFITYDGPNSLSKIKFNSSAITNVQTTAINGIAGTFRTSGNLLLTGTGIVINTVDVIFKLNLGASGLPCLDAPNHRAYLVKSTSIAGFSTATGLSIGTVALPAPSPYGISPRDCVRWGTDGLAVIGDDANLYMVRWSAAVGP